jgi:hypothetical protein
MTSYPIPLTCLSLSKETFFFLLSLLIQEEIPHVSLSKTKVNISVSLVQDPILVIDKWALTISSGTLFEFL